MPSNTTNFGLYKPDVGQTTPEWGTPFNQNLDKIDRLLLSRPGIPLWGAYPPSSPSPYDDEFDDGVLDSKWYIEDNGTGTLVYNEDDFDRITLRKSGGAPSVCYLYQSASSPIDGSTVSNVYFQTLHINYSGKLDLEDTVIEGGIFVGSSGDDIHYSLLVWTNVFSNLVRVYSSNTLLDTTGKGSELYSYDYGRIPHLYFFRVAASWTGSDWDLMFQVSYDGLHWKNLKYVSSALADIDTFGFVVADNNVDSDLAYATFYHFRYNYSPNPSSYK